MLPGMCHFDQASVFAESCLEYKLVKNIKQTASLIEAVFLEYARYLNSLSLLRGMRYYCEKAGEKAFHTMWIFVLEKCLTNVATFELYFQSSENLVSRASPL